MDTFEESAAAKVVRARRFEVVDEAGETRAALRVLPDGSPGLDLYDAAGEVRAGLEVNRDGSPALRLADAAGNIIWQAP